MAGPSRAKMTDHHDSDQNENQRVFNQTLTFFTCRNNIVYSLPSFEIWAALRFWMNRHLCFH